ncbi:hypothetical protein M5K25_008223 [Dendrobium thyrsiflorum]|uniref:Uncharacterized protein n=1 Tax=Dendrobium thyrsiflorum TaxID=117978 RepID=A0ABD0VEZ6_DENTH
MEFDLWDSETEDEEEQEGLASPELNLPDRIQQLESPLATWAWDDNWTEVRGGSDDFECSGSGRDFDVESNGYKDAVLFRESMDFEEEELDSVPFAGEAEASGATWAARFRRVSELTHQVSESTRT